MKPSITAQKSFRAGHIRVKINASASNHLGSETISTSVSIDLTLDAARSLRDALDTCVEKEEAKMAAKQASDERRKKWRDREVAAGRMKIFSLNRL